MKSRTCSKCQNEFILRPNKPGLIHHCEGCSKETEEKQKGWMVWEGKHTPVLYRGSASQANRINAQRHGHHACLPGISSYTRETDTVVKSTMGVSKEYTALEQNRRELAADRKKGK